jgi:hypothetical protein
MFHVVPPSERLLERPAIQILFQKREGSLYGGVTGRISTAALHDKNSAELKIQPWLSFPSIPMNSHSSVLAPKGSIVSPRDTNADDEER